MQSNSLDPVVKRNQKISRIEGHNRLSLQRLGIPRNTATSDSTEHYKDLPLQIQNLLSPTPPSLIGKASEQNNFRLQLFEATAVAKTLTSYVSMHLDDQWRKNIFFQLDLIHQVDEWDEDLSPVNRASMSTFLKTILKLKVKLYPGLGLSSKGHLIAAWTEGSKRLTLEFMPNEKVKWLISRKLDDLETERAAGSTTIGRLYQCLTPYDLGSWFISKS